MSVSRNSNILFTPENVKSTLRVSSNDRFIGRSTQPGDFSAEQNTRYSISYLPGIQEHTIETGNTLAESQMKVVMFACEVERLTSQNYELVKENEVLRTQVDKSLREKDLETKLAIILAENEKLNQVIEDLYDVYMTEKGGDSHDGYEKRIAELLHDLDDWKGRYSHLEVTNNTSDLQAALSSLQEENNRLKQNLKDNKNTSDNDRLVKEYRDKLVELLHENENLKDLLKNKIEALEVKASPVRTTEVNLKASQAEKNKSSANRSEEELRRKNTEADKLKEQMNALLRDNENLNNTVQKQLKELEELRAAGKKSLKSSQTSKSDHSDKIQLLADDNKELNALLKEKLAETDKLKKQAGEIKKVNARVEELTVKINALLDRNNQLNNLVNDKSNEVEELRRKLDGSQSGSEASSDLKAKLIMVTSENERLNTVLLQKLEELEKARRQPVVIEQSGDLKGKLQLVTVENERLNTLLLEKLEDIEKLRRQVHELQAGNKSELLGAKLRDLLDENEKLNILLLDKVKENDLLRQQLTEMGGSKWQIDELNRTVEIYRNDIDRLNGLLASKVDNLRSDSIVDDLKVKLVLLMAETERLNLDINQRNGEIQNLASRVSNDQSDKLRTYIERLLVDNDNLNRLLLKKLDDIDEVRRRLTSLEGSSYAQDRTNELEGTVRELLGERERLTLLLRAKLEEIEGLNREINSLKSEHTTVVGGLSVDLNRHKEQLKSAGVNHQAKASEADFHARQVANLEQEIHRLVSVISEKEDEITRLRLNAAEPEGLRQALEQAVQDKSELQELLNNTYRELETLKVKAALVEKLDNENENLRVFLNTALTEIDDLKMRYSELEHLRSQEIDELKEQFELLKKFNEEIKELQIKSAAERTAYETQLAQCQVALTDLEKQRDMLLNENDRLTKLNVNRLEENEKMKRKIVEGEEVIRLEVSELKSQVEHYKAAAHDVKQLTIKYSADRAADQTMIKQLEQLNENYKAEIEKLYELTEERKSDIESIKKNNEELRESQSKIVIRLREEAETDDSISHDKFELLQSELQELEKAKNEYKKQAERNSTELTRRNKELVEKIQELDILKLKYEEGLANYQALNTKLFARLSV